MLTRIECDLVVDCRNKSQHIASNSKYQMPSKQNYVQKTRIALYDPPHFQLRFVLRVVHDVINHCKFRLWSSYKWMVHIGPPTYLALSIHSPVSLPD